MSRAEREKSAAVQQTLKYVQPRSTSVWKEGLNYENYRRTPAFSPRRAGVFQRDRRGGGTREYGGAPAPGSTGAWESWAAWSWATAAWRRRAYRHYPEYLRYCVGLDVQSQRGEDGEIPSSVWDQMEAQLKRKNCVGIKLYPGYNPWYITDPMYGPCYELAEAYGKTGGRPHGGDGGDRSHPKIQPSADGG